ncbi:hypothetical protein F5890DRAFT_1488013 [Lentinula detonsa]|uniref:Uncharacterized protein n=1 Tax=Lentinula detonsa TaxID=2804962 RepID=A0AA38UW50_9AGAR|nr:hypothetical protein F5890DRAFT_1488013 [Lentinula detonsa]
MLSKTLFLIIISSLLSLSVTSPLPAAQDHTEYSRESGEFNVTSPSSSSGNVKRAPATKLVLNLIGCTMDVITWASYNPGRLTAKEDGILYGSVVPRGGLYFAVDPNDADVIGRASKCPRGTFVVVEYDFDGTGLRIVDMTAGQNYDETAHAVVGYFDPSRIGIRGKHMKMYVLQNPIAIAESHLKLKMINHKSR